MIDHAEVSNVMLTFESQRQRRRGDVLFTGALGTFLFTVFGAGGGAAYEYDAQDHRPIAEIEQELAAYPEELAAITEDREEMVEQMGEACVAAVSVYVPGGLLAEDANEESAVDDILRSADPACDGDVSQIRIAYRSGTEIAERQAEIDAFDYTATTQELRETKEFVEDDAKRNYVWIGGAIPFVLGTVGTAGVLLSDAMRNKRQDRRWRRQQREVR